MGKSMIAGAAALGVRRVKVIEIAVAYGSEPDYDFKTFHHDRYWSAHAREQREHGSVDTGRNLDHNKFHDTMLDLFPDKTAALLAEKDRSWRRRYWRRTRYNSIPVPGVHEFQNSGLRIQHSACKRTVY